MKITMLDGSIFDDASALQQRPAALYFTDSTGQPQAVRLDQVRQLEPAPKGGEVAELPVSPTP